MEVINIDPSNHFHYLYKPVSGINMMGLYYTVVARHWEFSTPLRGHATAILTKYNHMTLAPLLLKLYTFITREELLSVCTLIKMIWKFFQC